MKKAKQRPDGGIALKIIMGINIVLLAGMGWLIVERQPKIAYVQSGYLLSNYQGFKDASLAYQQKSMQWQANIDTLTSELGVLRQKYQRDLPELSSKEKELSMELIKTKEQQLKQYRLGIQQKATQEDQEMTANVVQEVNAFLKEYGERRDYQIIFGATDMGNIVYAREAIDLTEEVLAALNKKYKGE